MFRNLVPARGPNSGPFLKGPVSLEPINDGERNTLEDSPGGVGDPSIRQTLLRIIARLRGDPSLQEDLLQEALIHFWLVQERRPGQTQSWYIQSCRFRLQNYLRSGRSLDSAKHRVLRTASPETDDEVDNLLPVAEGDALVLSAVSARDILALLARSLTPFANHILRRLVDGFRPSEIAAELGISHTAVIKHRRKIARIALELGMASTRKGVRPSATSGAQTASLGRNRCPAANSQSASDSRRSGI